MMRSHLIAALGLAAVLAGPAYAADMGVMKAPPRMVAEDPWAGFYLGISGGGAKASSSHDAPPVGTIGTFDQKGWVAGGTAGYNWRFGPAIFGLEIDISGADIAGSTTTGNCALVFQGCETKISWFDTGRARLAYPIGIFMPYVTGGAAMVGLKAREIPSNTGSMPNLWGWVAGGGVELMFIPQWTFKAEYLHAAFSGQLQANDGPIVFNGGGVFNVTQHPVDMVRVGINYYLGSDKQITAR
jgi:outer membrane immunogenic protein